MSVNLFFSYARQDQPLRDKLEDHLSNLKYRGLIATWHDREINAGNEWAQQIDVHLNAADIILLLISSNFMASEYCYSIEMTMALALHKMKQASVIPILLRPVLFTDAPFSDLQFLPKNGKPVVSWRSRDNAFVDIALGIEQTILARSGNGRFGHVSGLLHMALTDGLALIHHLPSLKKEEQKKSKELTYYKEALAAYDKALLLNFSDATALKGKGNALYALRRYEQALKTFEQAASVDPTATCYTCIGNALLKLIRFDAALATYEEAIALDPTFALAYHGMSEALKQLGRIEEAQQAREKAKQLGY